AQGAQWLGEDLADLLPSAGDQADLLHQVASGATPTVVFSVKCCDARFLPCDAEVTVARMVGPDAEQLLLWFRPLAEPADRLPHRDALTGLADRRELAPHRAIWQQASLGQAVPHAVLFLQGEKTAADLGDALRITVDLARNYALFVEYQVVPESQLRAGVVVSPRFPTLTLNWEAHPYEDVPQALGLWLQPFADLSDVAEVLVEGDGVSLVLNDHAARRIDAHARIHGHRRFSVRMIGLEKTSAIGPYTWISGLRHIPGLPLNLAVLSPSGDEEWVSIDVLRQQFASRVAARNRVEERFALGVDAVWTAPPVKPRYRESFTLWVIQGEERTDVPPFYAPWLGVPDLPRRWVALRAGAAEKVSTLVPPSWRVEENATVSVEADSLVLAGDSSAADSAVFQSFLRQYVGRDVAVLMDGEVIGIVVVSNARSDRLVLASQAPEQNAAIVSRWEATRVDAMPAPRGGLAETSLADDPVTEDLDFFQVRLMAEPQDRELIPVTHFAAPGMARGVLVAVQNEVILNSHSISGARLETQADRLFLHLSLTDEGKDALSDACFAHLGKQLAIVYEDQLLCAPTIIDWELEELSFKGMNEDWPEVAQAMVVKFEG
ncbi:MAG: hypothetical protein L3K26_15615, partial [Candidatus Hydrogenedentes bacterium]|nr:hypothetical protein [Candidatus Hydrogenedentota bacterium]